MSKDPAFLFYDGDAARDVSHMNRIERGCYFDLIQAQRKFGGYTVEQARKILGKDFDTSWDALTLILKEENGIFFIEWMKESIHKRMEYSEIQRKRIQDYWDKKNSIPRNNRGNSTDIPLEDENAIVIASENFKPTTPKRIHINTKYDFDALWVKYPRKMGKHDALRCFKAQVKTPQDYQSIIKALDNFLKSDVVRGDQKFIPHGSTWFNNRWRDYIEWSEVLERKTDEHGVPIEWCTKKGIK
jgi:hypothetical protein